jgi:hypothetical protein
LERCDYKIALVWARNRIYSIVLILFHIKKKVLVSLKLYLPEKEEITRARRKLDYEELHNLGASSDTADGSKQEKWDG